MEPGHEEMRILGQEHLYDCLPTLVHVVCDVLARGASGFDRVSICVAVPTAVSDRRSCGPRRPRAGGRRNNAAFPITERAISHSRNLMRIAV